MAKIILISAMTIDKVIGINGEIPWNMPSDMAFFSYTTMNKCVVMGRETFKSMNCKPLEGRMNIVLTREITEADNELESHYDEEGKQLLFMMESEFREFAKGYKHEIFCIGGAQIYKLFLDKFYVSEMLVTIVHTMYQQIENVEEDVTYFPQSDFPKHLWSSELVKKGRKWMRGEELNDYHYDIFLFTNKLEVNDGLITGVR